jgi:outer membrane protein TolC
MKINLTKRRKWLLGTGAALLLTATPSFALFGIGDIVFDPTSYASLVSQLTTLETQYKMLKNNVIHAKSALDALNRLSNLALSARPNLNHAFMRAETAQAIDFVLYCERDQTGRRRVRELITVAGYSHAANRAWSPGRAPRFPVPAWQQSSDIPGLSSLLDKTSLSQSQ